jgi:hypothetical protein
MTGIVVVVIVDARRHDDDDVRLFRLEHVRHKRFQRRGVLRLVFPY